MKKFSSMFHWGSFVRKYEKKYARLFYKALTAKEVKGVKNAMLLIELIERDITQKLREFYRDLQMDTGKSLEEFLKDQIDHKADPALKAMYYSLYTRGAERITNLTLEQRQLLGYVLKVSGVEISPDELARKIRSYVGLTKPQVQRLLKIEQNLKIAGEDPEVIKRILEKTADSMRRYRSMVIARTELAWNYTQGQLSYLSDVQRQLGAEMYKIWQVTPDDILCDICANLDGEKRLLNEAFSIGVDGPPAHPNCRCALMYEIK